MNLKDEKKERKIPIQSYEIIEDYSDNLNETTPLILNKDPVSIKKMPCQTLEDIYQISQINAFLHTYTLVTPISEGIKKALNAPSGTPEIIYPIVAMQFAQTTFKVLHVASSRLNWERTTKIFNKLSMSVLPRVFFAFGMSTKIWFMFQPIFKHTSPIVQAVAVPLTATAASLAVICGVPQIIQCYKGKNLNPVTHKPTITKGEIVAKSVCGWIAYDGNIAGIMNLLYLQKDTIFGFMKPVTPAQLLYIPALIGTTGIINALCHTSKSETAHKISDYALDPLWTISQEALETLYWWFQMNAMVVITETNNKIPTATFWTLTGLSIGLGVFKIGLGLVNHYVNGIKIRQDERAGFYPNNEQELFDVNEEMPIAEVKEELIKNINEPQIIIEEMEDESILKKMELIDDSDESTEEEILSNDDIYNNVYSALPSLSIFGEGASRFIPKAREIMPESCTIL